jgi:hypothetical protein
MTTYSIDRHSHTFAAWAACRAASVKGCRFSVEHGRNWLEAAGFTETFRADSLPLPKETDAAHREWRDAIVKQAKKDEKELKHGQAAKLISVYLKARFVCGGYAEHSAVAALHPPIDRLLLNHLITNDFAGQKAIWRHARDIGWSKLSQEQYEQLIGDLRLALKEKPFWMIEEYWQGHQ